MFLSDEYILNCMSFNVYLVFENWLMFVLVINYKICICGKFFGWSVFYLVKLFYIL